MVINIFFQPNAWRNYLDDKPFIFCKYHRNQSIFNKTWNDARSWSFVYSQIATPPKKKNIQMKNQSMHTYEFTCVLQILLSIVFFCIVRIFINDIDGVVSKNSFSSWLYLIRQVWSMEHITLRCNWKSIRTLVYLHVFFSCLYSEFCLYHKKFKVICN